MLFKKKLATRILNLNICCITSNFKFLTCVYMYSLKSKENIRYIIGLNRLVCVSCNCEQFYRATLCVSAVFAVARCPSVTWIVSRWLNIIVILLSQLSSPIVLIFWPPPQRRYPIPTELLQRGRKVQGGGEFFCDFRLKSPSISETVRDRPTVTMER